MVIFLVIIILIISVSLNSLENGFWVWSQLLSAFTRRIYKNRVYLAYLYLWKGSWYKTQIKGKFFLLKRLIRQQAATHGCVWHHQIRAMKKYILYLFEIDAWDRIILWRIGQWPCHFQEEALCSVMNWQWMW